MALTDLQKLVRAWARGYENSHNVLPRILELTTKETLDTVVAQLHERSTNELREHLAGYPCHESDWKGWRLIHLHGSPNDPDTEAERIRVGVQLLRNFMEERDAD